MQIKNKKKDILSSPFDENKFNNIKAQLTENKRDLKLSELKNVIISNKIQIAIHLHIFYEDLTEEVLSYIMNMPYKFDLFISVVSDSTAKHVASEIKKRKYQSKLNKYKIIIVQNRGRDIAPFVATFSNEIKKYEYICHIHTKKNIYAEREHDDWRIHLYKNLFGSSEDIKKIFSIFTQFPEIGLIYPAPFINFPYWGYTWLSSKGLGNSFLQKLGIKTDISGYIEYAVGSMFWARVDSIIQLFKLELSYEDFPKEPVPNDGTLSNVIERSFVYLVYLNNKGFVEVDFNNDVLRYGHSEKNLWQYFRKSFKEFKSILGNYETISFDIFDTLLTRPLINPDHVFNIVEENCSHLNLEFGFKTQRKRAEVELRQKTPDKLYDPGIDDIYLKLEEITGIDRRVSDEIKKIECDTEIALSMPRREIIDIYNHFASDNKNILLISDMYLNSHAIRSLLSKNKIDRYNKILLSSEMDIRKDTGTMWEYVKNEYNIDQLIHVGDNEQSDVQMTCDRGIAYYHVMSPQNLFRISNINSEYIDNKDFANSIYFGTIIQKLFNSPFAINENSGRIKISSAEILGYVMYGPLILNFLIWLINKLVKTGVDDISFLSPAGYLLKRIFDYIILYLNENSIIDYKPNSKYLLASQRVAQAASIENDKDIHEILLTPYHGSIENFLKKRFGLNINTMNIAFLKKYNFESNEICLPGDTKKVIKIIRDNYRSAVLSTADQERNIYNKYLSKMINKNENKIAVVDLGYAGTIQKCLNKLLNKKIGSYYFMTTEESREIVNSGNIAEACFEKSGNEPNSKFYKYSIFLESILTANHGKLIQFKQIGDNVLPEFMDTGNESNWDLIRAIHDGIFEYVKDVVNIHGKYILKHLPLSDSILSYYTRFCTNGDLISEDLRKDFITEDFYISNKFHKASGMKN